MVRMSDLSESVQTALLNVECPEYDSKPWVSGPPLSKRRVAIVSSPGCCAGATGRFLSAQRNTE